MEKQSNINATQKDIGTIVPGPTVRKTLSKVEDLITAHDTTYVVVSHLSYVPDSETKPEVVIIGKNVTLIFEGGSISGAFTLKGTDTALQAAMTKIFGEDTTVEGTWLIPYAVPQWFDAEAGKDAWIAKTPHDCSVAINKAINMKQIGEVFLPHGNYFISHPVKLITGIQLTGEYEARKSYNSHEDDRDIWGLATSIIPFFENGVDGFTGHAIIEINVVPDASGTDGEWDKAYVMPTGKLRNINITNYKVFFGSTLQSDYTAVFKIAEKVCCLVGGGFIFEGVYFTNFRRAIKWISSHYQDNKTVERCQFMLSSKLRSRKYDSTAYLIESVRHGDSVIITGCMFDNGAYIEKDNPAISESHKAIHLVNSYGASITANIINSDIVIESCLATDYSNNHMEMGAQLRIVTSDMAVRNNYIEKGYRPSIVVDVSNDDHSDLYEHASVFSQLQLIGNIFFMFTPPETDTPRTPVKSVCQYDMAICSGLTAPYSISLEQNYRVVRNTLRSNQPTGMMIGTFATIPENAVDFTAFNKRSFFLSNHSQILRNQQIVCERYFEDIPVITATIMSNSQIQNALLTNSPIAEETPHDASDWPYQYWGQVIIDEARGIVGERFEFFYGDYDSQLGNLISLHNNSTNSSFMLRITRQRRSVDGRPILAQYDTVDIPVIGIRYLYDNYFSVNGYRWVSHSGKSTAVAKRPIDAVQFHNGNVKAYGTVVSGSSVAGWLKNDTVINTGSGSTALWYCDGSQWLSR